MRARCKRARARRSRNNPPAFTTIIKDPAAVRENAARSSPPIPANMPRALRVLGSVAIAIAATPPVDAIAKPAVLPACISACPGELSHGRYRKVIFTRLCAFHSRFSMQNTQQGSVWT